MVLITPIAVYLGEFGADNVYGYSYQTGDLHLVTANNPPNGTGYADGGPDPNSRVKFHGYVANAAIDRGFSFSAWDDGGKGSKTIHLRKDSGLTVYDINHLTINSFDPKDTSPSTVIENSLWVEDVKNALLSPYSEIQCNHTSILKNFDFECGYSTSWSLLEIGNIIQATFEDAGFAARTGSHGAKVVVNQAHNLNSVILANQTISNDGSFDNMQLKFAVHGKASVSGLQFKLRVKYEQNSVALIIIPHLQSLVLTQIIPKTHTSLLLMFLQKQPPLNFNLFAVVQLAHIILMIFLLH